MLGLTMLGSEIPSPALGARQWTLFGLGIGEPEKEEVRRAWVGFGGLRPISVVF